jgi:hypothetical protein
MSVSFAPPTSAHCLTFYLQLETSQPYDVTTDTLQYNTSHGVRESQRHPETTTGIIVGPIVTIVALVAGVVFWNSMDKLSRGPGSGW